MSDLYLAPSTWLLDEFSSKSNKILLLGPICLNLGFE